MSLIFVIWEFFYFGYIRITVHLHFLWHLHFLIIVILLFTFYQHFPCLCAACLVLYRWPLNSMTLNYMGALRHRFLSINTCTVFDQWLGVLRCGRPMGLIVLSHFIQETWASAYFGIRGGPGSNGTEGQLNFLWSQKLNVNLKLCVGWESTSLNPLVVHGSTVDWFLPSVSDLNDAIHLIFMSFVDVVYYV